MGLYSIVYIIYIIYIYIIYYKVKGSLEGTMDGCGLQDGAYYSFLV